MHIFSAIRNRYLKMLKKVIIRNADLNPRDAKGRTPLMLLVKMSLRDKFVLPAIELLLKNGADINAVDNAEMSVLMHADNFTYKSEDRKLSFNHRNPRIIDTITILDYYDSIESFYKLMKNFSSASVLAEIYTKYRADRVKLINLLCKYQPDLFYQNSLGQNVIHLAASARNFFKCFTILEHEPLLQTIQCNNEVYPIMYYIENACVFLTINE